VLHWACADVLAHHQRHQMLCQLAGNQAAIESFRNGMVEEKNGEVMPKSDPATELLLGMVNQARGNAILS